MGEGGGVSNYLNPSVRQNLSLEATTPLSSMLSAVELRHHPNKNNEGGEGGRVLQQNVCKKELKQYYLSFQTLKHDTMKTAVVLGG